LGETMDVKPAQSPVCRVLLTGGPGAGKSSAIAILRDRLSKRGFRVVVVPENATALLSNSDGFDPSWKGTSKVAELQRIFLQYQLDVEKAYSGIAQLGNKQAVMLFDRGVLDGRLFCTEEEWAQVLEGVGKTEEELLGRYDMVVHVTSVAQGLPSQYDFGPGSSNPARYHTAEEAKEADALTTKIYEKHPQVRHVPNFADFSNKIACVLGIIEDALHVDGLAGKRQRVQLADDHLFHVLAGTRVDEDVFVPGVEVFTHDISYSARQGSASECLRRRVALETGDELLELRVQHAELMTRRILNRTAYELLLEAQHDPVHVRKEAACFTWEGKYYELICYTAGDSKRVCVLDQEVDSALPGWVKPKLVAESRSAEKRLTRNETMDMVEPAQCSGVPTLAQMSATPELLQASALVGLQLDSPSPPRKRRRTSESTRATDLSARLDDESSGDHAGFLDDSSACLLCAGNSILDANGRCTCAHKEVDEDSGGACHFNLPLTTTVG